MTLAQSIAIILPFATSLTVGWMLARAHAALSLADVPNERSLHAVPKPRVGGLGVVAGSIPLALWAADGAIAVALASALALAAISLVDDVRSLPIHVRLPAHLAAAIAIVLASPSSLAEWPLAACVAVVAVVWSTNLFNFMDGADGLAGGMALIGFSTYAAVAHVEFPELAACAAAIASASAGFLLLNFPPARIFMGDAGSIPLGFLAAALGWIGIAHGTWPIWFPVVVFSPFIADATVTLARRVLRREPFWRAHRQHYYQRLVLAGWSHRRLALGAYALMLGAAASAVAAFGAGGIWPYVIIAAWTAMYAMLFIAIDRRASSNGARERRPE